MDGVDHHGLQVDLHEHALLDRSAARRPLASTPSATAARLPQAPVRSNGSRRSKRAHGTIGRCQLQRHPRRRRVESRGARVPGVAASGSALMKLRTRIDPKSRRLRPPTKYIPPASARCTGQSCGSDWQDEMLHTTNLQHQPTMNPPLLQQVLSRRPWR